MSTLTASDWSWGYRFDSLGRPCASGESVHDRDVGALDAPGCIPSGGCVPALHLYGQPTVACATRAGVAVFVPVCDLPATWEQP